MDKLEIKPNLFIVGAARSGTTSLWYHLKDHNRVFMPNDELNKEPAYFSVKGRWQGYAGYLDIFKRAEETHKWIGEVSTAYLTDPTSPQNIYEFNPNSKIIISLRNPADRAYSLYNWMVKDGYEYANSFEKALRLEDIRITKKIPNWFEPEYYWNYLYFHSGLYFKQVKRYLDLFSQNVHVIKFEALKKDFNNEYKKICSFLDLKPNKIGSEILNKSSQVYSAQIQFILRKVTNDLIDDSQIFYKSNKYQQLNKILKTYIISFLKLCIREKTVINPFKLLLTFIKITGLIVNKGIKFNNIRTKIDRDVLLTIGVRNNRSNILNANLRKRLLIGYKDDILKLEKLLNMNFKEWLI